jgi:uncharacterized protein (DUF2062 family)
LALRDKLREVISTNDSPKKIAFSFAMGIFIGLSPLIGFHTALGIGAALLFRTNRFVTIVAVYISNPWTVVPIYTFSTWLGAKLLGIDRILPPVKWHALSCSYLLNELRSLFWPFFVGSTVVALVSALAGYIIVHHAVVKQRTITGQRCEDEKVER